MRLGTLVDESGDHPCVIVGDEVIDLSGVDWGAIERYADQLARLGKRLVWGPGRHGPGRNLYTYTADPDNAIVEAYADLLIISDESNYVPINWNASGDAALNLWGPPPPSDYRDYGTPVLPPLDAEH